MKRLILIASFILMRIGFMYSQSDTSIVPKWVFKINPLQLVMGEARLQIERPCVEKKGIELILGYIYKGEYFYDPSELQTWFFHNDGIYGIGFKVGIGYKLIVKNSNEQKKYFINPILFYKYEDFRGWNNYNYYGNGLIITDMRYHVGSFQLNYGKTLTIGRAIIDKYIGLGFRSKYGIISTKSTKSELTIESPRKLESWIYPSFHFGCNIGYVFIKK